MATSVTMTLRINGRLSEHGQWKSCEHTRHVLPGICISRPRAKSFRQRSFCGVNRLAGRAPRKSRAVISLGPSKKEMHVSWLTGLVVPEHDSVEDVGSEKLEHHRRIQPKDESLGGRGVIIGESQHTCKRTQNVSDQLIELCLFGVVLPSECRRCLCSTSSLRSSPTWHTARATGQSI